MTVGVRRIRNESSIVAPAKTQVSEDILRYFIDRLGDGSLRPGDRLLGERELAQTLQVSRPSLREAMRTMAMLGVIDIRPGQGMFVRNPDATVLRDFLSVMLAMRPQIYQSAILTREAIECQAVRTACNRAQQEDIDTLTAALERIERTVEDPDAGAEADFNFHMALVKASHDEVMLFVYEALQPLLRRDHTVRRRVIRDRADIQQAMGPAHRYILDAIVNGDPELAAKELRRHFRIGYEDRSLDEQPSEAVGLKAIRPGE